MDVIDLRKVFPTEDAVGNAQEVHPLNLVYFERLRRELYAGPQVARRCGNEES